MTTYLFPGQGSQTRGMGSSLFSEFPDLVEKADRILDYSIATLCLQDPHNQLNLTEFTQPALYTVNALFYLEHLKDTKRKPDYVMGHSLGEYSALFAAGVFDFETGLALVKKRGELMSKSAKGAMAAVIGLTGEEVSAVLKEHHLSDVTIANFNSYSQIVISGSKEQIYASESLFKNAGAQLFVPLKVSGAFHSHYMDKAQSQFSEFLCEFTFNLPTLAIIANVNAKPYHPKEVAANLSSQINHSVQWTQSVGYLLQQGETNFIEVGPGKVLTGLISRIQAGQ